MLLLDDAVGTELDPLPSRLLISKDSQTRSIWPVHLAGWQALGWQLLSPCPAGIARAGADRPGASCAGADRTGPSCHRDRPGGAGGTGGTSSGSGSSCR